MGTSSLFFTTRLFKSGLFLIWEAHKLNTEGTWGSPTVVYESQGKAKLSWYTSSQKWLQMEIFHSRCCLQFRLDGCSPKGTVVPFPCHSAEIIPQFQTNHQFPTTLPHSLTLQWKESLVLPTRLLRNMSWQWDQGVNCDGGHASSCLQATCHTE